MVPIKIPYLTTRIETDLMITLALTPLWWFLGFNIFIYHAVTLLCFLKLIVLSMQTNTPIRFPKLLFIFVVFLVSYLASITANIGNIPSQRILASFNNYTMLGLGFLLMLIVYNVDSKLLLANFFKASRLLCFATAIIGFYFLGLWLLGYRNLEIQSALGVQFPNLLNYPYFFALLVIKGTVVDWLSTGEFPRLALYSSAPTSTGGFMIYLIPFMMGYYALHKRKYAEFWLNMIVSVIILFFSLSRSAVCAFIASYVFVFIITRGKAVFLAAFALLTTFIASGLLFQSIEWVLNIRESSNLGRLSLYEQAFSVLAQHNLWFGVGGRLREGFTMQAIGSHALYVEIAFVSGIVGLTLFVLFQGLSLFYLMKKLKAMQNEVQIKVWRALGIAFLAMNLWLLTDTFFASPVVAYGYYLVMGFVLSLEKFESLRPHDPDIDDEVAEKDEFLVI